MIQTCVEQSNKKPEKNKAPLRTCVYRLAYTLYILTLLYTTLYRKNFFNSITLYANQGLAQCITICM